MSCETATCERKEAGSCDRKEERRFIEDTKMNENIYTEPIDAIQDTFYSVPLSKDDKDTNKQAENIKVDIEEILSGSKSFQVLENIPEEFVLLVGDIEESQRNDSFPCFLVPKQSIKHLSGNINRLAGRRVPENAKKNSIEVHRVKDNNYSTMLGNDPYTHSNKVSFPSKKELNKLYILIVYTGLGIFSV